MSTASPRPPADAPADAGCCDGGGDPHDHSGHDHPPTGAEVVGALVRGFSVLSLAIPVLALGLLIGILLLTPSTPLVLGLGALLGVLQLGTVVLSGLAVSRTRSALAVHPGLLVARVGLDEALRLAVVLLALVLFAAEPRTPLGLWIGAGCALVWLALATAQMISARSRIAQPSAWSQDLVSGLLSQKVGIPRTMAMRLLDVIGTAAFQIGATILVITAPIMVLATIVLGIASGLSTLVLQRRMPAERTRSMWAFAPIAVGVLTVLLAILSASTAPGL
ncbi:MAG: hypothetical protein Q4G40_09040 [Brachybacterium sp.]|nr:hypothetical protein [Brachybacterium sp.]